MPASFQTHLEMLLHDLGPAWEYVGSDPDRLAAGCRDWLLRELPRDLTPLGTTAQCRALWILDRILPELSVDLFRELHAIAKRDILYFSLARRDPDFLASVSTKEHESDGYAIRAGWIDRAASGEELLGWNRICAANGWKRDKGYDQLAVEVYCRHDPDRDALVAFALDSERSDHFDRWAALEYLLREAAPHLPKTKRPVQDIGDRLRAAGFNDVATLLLKVRKATSEPRAAWLVWIAQRSSSSEDLEALIEAEDEMPYSPMRRFAEIAPKDRFDLWDDMLRVGNGRLHPIYYFCEWMDPDCRDVLLRHFEYDDDHRAPDWGECAFHKYLWSLPKAVVPHLDEHRPAWQARAIDRFLHAPDRLKPPPFVADDQDVEHDFRLRDPFNGRSY